MAGDWTAEQASKPACDIGRGSRDYPFAPMSSWHHGAVVRAPAVRGTLRALALAVLLSVPSGCGKGSTAESPDERVNCIKDKGIAARKIGSDEIQVGRPGSGPRIVVLRTPGEAEAKDFANEAPGAEQIGRALLYVNDASDELLEEIEGCLE
jgi:hypothetical protein